MTEMKYGDAQLLTKYTTLHEDKLYFNGKPVETIPLQTWKDWMNEEQDPQKKTFFSMMLQRALKQGKKHP